MTRVLLLELVLPTRRLCSYCLHAILLSLRTRSLTTQQRNGINWARCPMALHTGLRASALGQLRVKDFRLDDRVPCVRVPKAL